ncbi:MAG: DUF1464 family protein [Archaeoglobaceae archaeon]
MVRALGIDPGTKSMDLCGLEDGKVVFERSLETVEVAENPEILIEAIGEFEADLIAAPSGYGVEVRRLDSIPLERLEDWYYTYILMTSREEIEKAVEKGFVGANIYRAMARTIVEMRRRNLPAVFIPGVVNLPTVPLHRKLNKVDMGTADKMAVTVLAVYDQSRRLKLNYGEVSLVLVEMGFGYNAVISVEGGRIVDGFGGTTMLGPGFLTMGYADQEVVQLAKNWEKADIFVGGCASIAGVSSLEEFVEERDGKARVAWEAMFEGVEKAVAASPVKPREILLSGRLTRFREVRKELEDRLSKYAEVRKLGTLEGAKITKETAQGYAVVADGLAGGKFSDLIDWMRIREAKGTCYDYIFHPKVPKPAVEF